MLPMYAAAWRDDKNIGDPAVVEAVLNDAGAVPSSCILSCHIGICVSEWGECYFWFPLEIRPMLEIRSVWCVRKPLLTSTRLAVLVDLLELLADHVLLLCSIGAQDLMARR